MSAMRTTIDRAGRLVVPKSIRDRLRMVDGCEVEITERSGVIEIVPVPASVEVVDTAEGAVAITTELLPPLTDAAVQRAIDESRR